MKYNKKRAGKIATTLALLTLGSYILTQPSCSDLKDEFRQEIYSGFKWFVTPKKHF